MCIAITHEPSASIDVGERGVQGVLDNNSLNPVGVKQYKRLGFRGGKPSPLFSFSAWLLLVACYLTPHMPAYVRSIGNGDNLDAL